MKPQTTGWGNNCRSGSTSDAITSCKADCLVNEIEEAASGEGTDDLTVDFILDKVEAVLRKRKTGRTTPEIDTVCLDARKELCAFPTACEQSLIVLGSAYSQIDLPVAGLGNTVCCRPSKTNGSHSNKLGLMGSCRRDAAGLVRLERS